MTVAKTICYISTVHFLNTMVLHSKDITIILIVLGLYITVHYSSLFQTISNFTTSNSNALCQRYKWHGFWSTIQCRLIVCKAAGVSEGSLSHCRHCRVDNHSTLRHWRKDTNLVLIVHLQEAGMEMPLRDVSSLLISLLMIILIHQKIAPLSLKFVLLLWMR